MPEHFDTVVRLEKCCSMVNGMQSDWEPLDSLPTKTRRGNTVSPFHRRLRRQNDVQRLLSWPKVAMTSWPRFQYSTVQIGFWRAFSRDGVHITQDDQGLRLKTRRQRLQSFPSAARTIVDLGWHRVYRWRRLPSFSSMACPPTASYGSR